MSIFTWFKKPESIKNLEGAEMGVEFPSEPEILKTVEELFDASVQEVYKRRVSTFISNELSKYVLGEEVFNETIKAMKLRKNSELTIEEILEIHPLARLHREYAGLCFTTNISTEQLEKKLAEDAIEAWDL